MVSPSKLQQQHLSRNNLQLNRNKTKKNLEFGNERTKTTTDAASATVRIQRGPKPLERKTFYLDIKNHALSTKLETKIKELGGGIELFLVKSVSLVISDKKEQSGPDKTKWGYASGESGGPPSLRSVEIPTPTPTPTPPTPYRSVEGPLSNSNSQRCSTTQRSKSRVDAMLERALTQPQQCSLDPLSNAYNWGIPIWSPYQLQAWLDKIGASLKESQQCSKSDSSKIKDLKIKHLKEPYIKFESYRRETRPVFAELQSWPKIIFDGEPGTCPFDVKKIKDKKDTGTTNKEIKENKEKNINNNISKGKDMTRRPRATATRARKTENSGYCEICRIDYRSLPKHLQSDQHLNFVRNEKNFLSLDNLIKTGASVEAFLKINRSKDVGKDCNHYRKRDHSLDNGLLPSDEKLDKREKSHIADFDIDEMKMLQCNGARRNLNTSLDSPHNLRTRAVTKHESGHLLRSKGKPSDEEDKSEKSLEKFIVKKRAKGIIWVEDLDSEDSDKDLENVEHVDYDGKPLFDNKNSNRLCEKNGDSVSINGSVVVDEVDNVECRRKDTTSALKETLLEANTKTKLNGYERKDIKRRLSEASQNGDESIVIKKEINHIEHDGDSANVNSAYDNDDSNSLHSVASNSKSRQTSRRGGKTYQKPRPRLSVEERLIEDNREYYKVEVLGNKLRSSAIPPPREPQVQQVEKSTKKDDNKPSSEKPVVVRFKRVRKSELSLLSDEAESFMFGDPRRGEESSDDDSIVPKDTESDRDTNVESFALSSSPHSGAVTKQENVDEDSQDSINTSRARKKRRTQTEALLKDNTEYYKFETPGSRLSNAISRYQAPLTGISEPTTQQQDAVTTAAPPPPPDDQHGRPQVDKLYPSKPTAEIEKMHFSFEAVPKSEPWYQTYQRQDEGAEYYFSESDSQKPFLLPYEIENFHEILQKSIQNGGHTSKRGGCRGRGSHLLNSRTPRKSPRCHASTLAILSTLKAASRQRREQQQQNQQQQQMDLHQEQKLPVLDTIHEESKIKENKSAEKSDSVDEDLSKIARNIDDMLSSEDNELPLQDCYEPDLPENEETPVGSEPIGAPVDLLELLENCHEVVANEGSSCASSDCSELLGNSDLQPAKRRKKKRKNKTGWPGNKMRRKMHIKHLTEELQKELLKQQEQQQQQEQHQQNEQEQQQQQDQQKQEQLQLTEQKQVPSPVKVEEEPDHSQHVQKDGPKENEQLIANSPNKGSPQRSKHKINREVVRENNIEESSTVLSEFTPKKKKKFKSSSSEDRVSPAKQKPEPLFSTSEDSEAVEPSNNSNPKRDKKKSPKRKNDSSSPLKKTPKKDASSEIFSPYKKIYNKKRPRHKLGSSRGNDSASSELNDDQLDKSNSEADQQRRSSMDMQPVVRVMKIEDQVDMVTVASNRRLRSSISPKRGKMQPPKKRVKISNNSAKRKVTGHSSKHS